jgi:hypothetical protein
MPTFLKVDVDGFISIKLADDFNVGNRRSRYPIDLALESGDSGIHCCGSNSYPNIVKHGYHINLPNSDYPADLARDLSP